MKFFFFFFLFQNFLLHAVDVSIESVQFEGNELVSSRQLSSAIVSEPGFLFQQKIALEDAQRIAQFYEDNGFYQVKVYPPNIEITESGTIIVMYSIEEYPQKVIDEILLQGNQYIETETILSQFPHSKLMLQEIPEMLKIIIDFYANQGFLFAAVKVDSVFAEEDAFQVHLNIDEGKFCRFEDYIFQGNKITKETTLLQISQLNNVRTITPKVLQIAQENVRKKPYISQAAILPINHKTALIQIKETNMTYFSGIIGYDNRETQKNRLNGFLNLEFLNLYGTDRAFTVHWQKLSTDRTSIELSYHESGIKQIPIGGDVTIFREEVDSTYIATHFELETYWYNMFMKYGLYYAYEDIFPGRIKVIEKTNFQKAGFFAHYQNLDYSPNPRHGSELYLRYYTIFNTIEKKKLTKQAVEGSYFQVLPISNRMFFTSKFTANLIQNKQITQFEYFYLGGNATLRGFMENQFYGFRTGLINFELRYLQGKDTRFFLFTDYGYVENSSYKYGKLFGFGFGLRVSTRLGLFGLDYGFGYQERLRNPLEGIVHFGIETKL